MERISSSLIGIEIQHHVSVPETSCAGLLVVKCGAGGDEAKGCECGRLVMESVKVSVESASLVNREDVDFQRSGGTKVIPQSVT